MIKPSSTQTPSSYSAIGKPTPSAHSNRTDGPNVYGPGCVPCEGQPGKDPNSFCGYTIHDNSYEHTPQTCVHRNFEFTVQNVTIAPDGVSRYGLVINGQVPGPKVEANWGDWISITLHNTLQHNGTSLHMHGLRQFETNEMDGVPSITQCPVAPGDSLTYTFRADNYGTSWYHSHFALQTYEGFFGPVVIHGPTALTYDYEETITLSDWSHTPVDQMIDAAQHVGPFPANGPRTLDTGLINGVNIWGADGSANQIGDRFVLNVKPNKKYLLRIISSSIQATWKLQIDGHKFKVIAADFVPIIPYETTVLNVNIGQRYDIVFETDQTPGNYWMRSDNQETCGSIRQGKDIKAIVHYQGTDLVKPSSTPYAYFEQCVDESLADLVPIVPFSVGAAADRVNERIFIAPYAPVNPNVFRWTLSDAFFQTEWSNPSLGGIISTGEVPYTGNLVIEAPKLGEWIYIIIDSVLPVPHPIHLHGHDFFIVAQGPGLYNSDIPLNLNNPPRRDVALMPGSGHLVIAYLADNPGVWLLHCHLGWHNAMGFALQIVEGLDDINDTIADPGQFDRTCRNWKAHASPLGIVAHDAGV
jgi:FtsP/CotA-like multicopper oxidase with cupredoxin domain